MQQYPVAGRIRSTIAPGGLVMALQRLSVKEVHHADRANPVLVLGKQHITHGQMADIDLPPLPPVFPKTGVIGRGSSLDQDVALDLEPLELQKMMARAF